MEAYFDNSATTIVTDSVKDIVVKTMTEDFGNPSAMHMVGVKAEKYIKEAQENKKKIILSVMVGILTILAAVPLFMVAGMFDMRTGVRITFIVIGIVVLIIGIAVACIMDREAGAFECPECHERFIPDMKSYIMAAHTLTKRKLICPKCGAHRYCKKVLTK